MKRFLDIVAVVLGASITLGMTAYAFANVSSAGKMTGIVTTAREAALEVADQPGARGSITVDRVVAPGPSWVVVHLDMDGKPGMRVGVQAVPAGESRRVRVALDPAAKLTDKLIVALHGDRGVGGTFEFAMDQFDSSPDKPYFVGGMELAKTPSIR